MASGKRGRAVPEENRSTADYYKLHREAIRDLAEADASNSPEVSEEELRKYRSGPKFRLSDWAKAILVKMWFAGSVCFFIYWGLSAYLSAALDLLLVFGVALGVVTDVITNNILRYLAKTGTGLERWMMFPDKKYITFFGNILYAFVFRYLPKVALAALCVCCACFTLDLTLGCNVFGLLKAPQYNVIGGWSLTPDQIYIGFTRLLYPFLCGLLISRILPGHRSESNPSGSPIHLKGGFWWCSLAIVVILAIPCIGGKQGVADGLYQALSILILFPLIVLAGAGSKTTDAKSTAVCKWLGDISYPIYITHYPLMYMQMNWVAQHASAPLWQHVAVAAGVFIMSIIVAWGLLKAYDEPVREWLKDHWLKRKAFSSK